MFEEVFLFNLNLRFSHCVLFGIEILEDHLRVAKKLLIFGPTVLAII